MKTYVIKNRRKKKFCELGQAVSTISRIHDLMISTNDLNHHARLQSRTYKPMGHHGLLRRGRIAPRLGPICIRLNHSYQLSTTETILDSQSAKFLKPCAR